jgi:hypothetical protein
VLTGTSLIESKVNVTQEERLFMADEGTTITAASFTGQWIGATQEYDALPAHLWEIHQQGPYLVIRTHWEGHSEMGMYHAYLVPGEPAFKIEGITATLVDKQHFVVPNWAYHIKGKSEGTFDVIFSRPGIAELTARAVYLKYRESLEEKNPTDSDA